MKKLFFLLLIVFVTKSYAYIPSTNEVRILFQQSAIKEDSCRKLLSILHLYNETNNTLLAGYRACATMIMAKHVFNPFRKLSYFSSGKNLLEKSIGMDKENIELRFLRFSIQTEVPSFLGYNSSKEQDKIFLLRGIFNVKDVQLKQLIIAFLKRSDYLTRVEKQTLI